MESILIRVIEAKNLAAMDRCGTSDPYVRAKCSFNKQSFKTRVIDKTLEPKWNEDFRFLNPLPTGTIRLKVWDKDKWTRDDFLGQVVITVKDFQDGKQQDVWLKLQDEPKKKNKVAPAEIHLVIQPKLDEKASRKGIPATTSIIASSGLTQNIGRSILDVYTFGKELGKGGFSVVKEGKHKQTNEVYAIKCISKKGVSEEELQLLSREVAIMQKLHHDNIVQLIEIFEEQDNLYLVLELVKGGELFDQILDRGSYSEKDAANIIRQILSAVSYMHKNGVAHRDLKPENLLVAGKEGDVIKIADFGLSKDFAQSDLQTSCGSPGYVAPEVLLGEPYDNSVDIWSIAVITYVLLCGYPPFYGDNPRDLFDQIINAEYTFPSPEWNDISAEAKEFISKILITNPAKRPTADECMQHAWLKNAPAKKLTTYTSIRGNLLSGQKKTT